MDWRKFFNFALSVAILGASLALLVLFFLASSGLMDTTSEPVIHAETNTTGVPVVNASNYSGLEGENLEIEIFNEVNDRRRSHGRDPFVHSERVRLIARLHSADMGKRGYFNHTNPDGIAPPGRHDRNDGCVGPNENIARIEKPSTNDTSEIAARVVSMWTNSPGHNTTQLSEYYHVSGVGVYVTEDRHLYVTQNFCREHPNA